MIDKSCTVRTFFSIDRSNEINCVVPEVKIKREIKRQLYFLLSSYLHRKYPWGSLTGTRPTLVGRESVREFTSEEKSIAFLTEYYGVHKDKSKLCIETAEAEDNVLAKISGNEIMAYIGIPFCKTRCSYCSFISSEATGKTNLLPEYLQALLKEIRAFLTYHPYRFSSLYIGGGTPTIFDDRQFAEFIHESMSLFAHENIREITVEAGRADTITESKLRTLHTAGIKRICINPQTLCNETLKRIGRGHTREDFITAYQMAKKIGFDVINTDLIAGLPEESSESFQKSLDELITLQPENITIHTLYKKRASVMQQQEIFISHDLEWEKQTGRMISYAHEKLHAAGYFPYYMYRQKNTIGGHENTGYAKPGFECIYNTAMMSDQYSIAAFGSGISKRIFPGGRLERCPGLKSPNEYIHRIDEIIQRKIDFFAYNIE